MAPMTLPNGLVGYVVSAQSGVPEVTTSRQTTEVSGTGTLRINQRNRQRHPGRRDFATSRAYTKVRD